jgi:hypothetical protein
MSQLEFAAKKGATVKPLGSASINGVTTSGFSVTLSHAEVVQRVQQMIDDQSITAAQGKQMLQSGQLLSSTTFDVWIDASDLLRRETLDVNDPTTGAPTKLVVDFSNYGTPVNIQAPPSTDVITSPTQLQQDLQATQGSSG